MPVLMGSNSDEGTTFLQASVRSLCLCVSVSVCLCLCVSLCLSVSLSLSLFVGHIDWRGQVRSSPMLAEWANATFGGAPHQHFLPCHSFFHTNLKSPCAEQRRSVRPSQSTMGTKATGTGRPRRLISPSLQASSLSLSLSLPVSVSVSVSVSLSLSMPDQPELAGEAWNQAAQAVIGDFVMWCPARSAAKALAKQGHDVFLYDFVHQPAESVNWPTGTHNLGAFHGTPHQHFLPCHSFSHTNLKSPCAEQAQKCRSCLATRSSLWEVSSICPLRWQRTGRIWRRAVIQTSGKVLGLEPAMLSSRSRSSSSSSSSSSSAGGTQRGRQHLRQTSAQKNAPPTTLSGGSSVDTNAAAAGVCVRARARVRV